MGGFGWGGVTCRRLCRIVPVRESATRPTHLIARHHESAAAHVHGGGPSHGADLWAQCEDHDARVRPRPRQKPHLTWGKNGVSTYGKNGVFSFFFSKMGCLKNKRKKRKLISDIWGKRGATYGEKGCVTRESGAAESARAHGSKRGRWKSSRVGPPDVSASWAMSEYSSSSDPTSPLSSSPSAAPKRRWHPPSLWRMPSCSCASVALLVVALVAAARARHVDLLKSVWEKLNPPGPAHRGTS